MTSEVSTNLTKHIEISIIPTLPPTTFWPFFPQIITLYLTFPMAAALECWPTRTTTTITDEDTVEQQQVLMKTHHRSETTSSSSLSLASKDSSILIHKNKFHKLGRNLSDAITSFKNTLNLNNTNNPESPPSSKKLAWASVLRNLTQLYPGTQLPDNLISTIRNHYNSLPLRYFSSLHFPSDCKKPIIIELLYVMLLLLLLLL